MDQLYGDALTVFEPAPPVDAPHGRLLMAGHQRLPSTDPASPPSRILPPGHPLGNTFSVGPDARRELRDAAAEVIGFSVGDRVQCCFRRYEGTLATVVRINPADKEIGITLNNDEHRILWCAPSELSSTPDRSYKAPRSPARRRTVGRAPEAAR